MLFIYRLSGDLLLRKIDELLLRKFEDCKLLLTTFKFKDMLVISSREFRQNQRVYFERADKGEQIIVQRGKDKSYALTPVNEDDVYFNAEMVERIKVSIKQAEEGKVKRISTPEGISDLLGL